MVGSLMYLIPTYADEDPCGMSGDSREVRREGAQSLGDCWLAGHQDAKNYKDGKVRSKCENKGIVPTEMELVLEYTQQGASHEVSEHLKMEMEIPCSNKIKFITACSFSNDSFEDIMKAQVSVIKASATLNIQAFKIKKSVSISFRMTQVHKMAKDHMMMIRDYDWMMISKKLKDHIQVKLKPKSLKFTTSDSQDTNQ
ncbi:hypothetical protein Tco_1080647 [Tanacetum coccineum]|uniref:Uncharacterized protein n=1 Tax=Tanacetum coccineum TaxID=301880 RepID=A0ABQ5HVA9_9ASTR